MSGSENRVSRIWMSGCVTCTALVMVTAYIELARVEQGRLFAAALPWEDPPSAVEIHDASETARTCRLPALTCLGMLGLAVGVAVPRVLRRQQSLPKAWRPILTVFLLSVVADLATTIWFFHSRGIDHELHPGVRLFGYAYGRSVGPLAGKAIQAAGVVALSLFLGRGGPILLSVVTVIYTAAAVYNILQM